MDKRKIKIVGTIFVILVVVFYVGISFYNNNKKITSENIYTSNKNISKNIDTLENIRNSIEGIKNDIASGKYLNLYGENVNIYMTEEEKLCEEVIEYRKWEEYDGITDVREMLDYELSFIQFYLGTDLNPEYLIDAASDNSNFDYEKLEMINSGGLILTEEMEYPYNNYETVCKMIDEGNYPSKYGDGMPRLGYSDGFNLVTTEKEYRYAYFYSGFFNVEKGNLKKVLSEESNLEYIRTYMFNDKNADDKYILSDESEISIKECINNAVMYLEEIPYKGKENIEYVPIYVDVYKFDTEEKSSKYYDKYILEVMFTRNYEGMYVEFGYPYDVNDYVRDDFRMVFMSAEGVEEVLSYQNNAYMENVGKEVTEIIDLKSVLDIMSNTIGNNSKYEIKNIGLVYTQKSVDDGLSDEVYEKYELVPVWRIDAVSEINGANKSFYVNALSGEIEYKSDIFVPLRIALNQ